MIIIIVIIIVCYPCVCNGEPKLDQDKCVCESERETKVGNELVENGSFGLVCELSLWA